MASNILEDEEGIKREHNGVTVGEIGFVPEFLDVTMQPD